MFLADDAGYSRDIPPGGCSWELVPSPARRWGLGAPLPVVWVELVPVAHTATAVGYVPFSELGGYASNPAFPVSFVAVSGWV